ncbi:MAG TPA: phosphoribosyltransferase [Candidimonas sp.]|nr:phosphoribosyltransferase [Candidimonas sp.]
MNALFRDRADAGRQLAAALLARHAVPPQIVLALPRGGVPVAYEVARALHAPLDVFIVRKLGAPQNKEYAMGAIASGGVTIVDEEAIEAMGVSKAALEAVVEAEQAELLRREKTYREGRPQPGIKGCSVVIVDDGLATGATMRAAIAGIKKHQPTTIVVATPVAAAETLETIKAEVDDVVCLATPSPFRAVGLWYASFEQTSDRQVGELLAMARAQQ